jgi:hypothetical protein
MRLLPPPIRGRRQEKAQARLKFVIPLELRPIHFLPRRDAVDVSRLGFLQLRILFARRRDYF